MLIFINLITPNLLIKKQKCNLYPFFCIFGKDVTESKPTLHFAALFLREKGINFKQNELIEIPCLHITFLLFFTKSPKPHHEPQF